MTNASTLDFIMAVAPIVILIFLMVKKASWPSYIALPFSALLVYGVKMMYFGADANLTNATVIAGLLTAFVPIFIIWGAILLFKTMEHTGAMDTVRAWLNSISPNPVAQLMIIGWAFAFLIEGASGFGTPAALAAPILIGLGFAPLPVACLALVMNSVPVTFGAVGTPTWFGLGQLNLPAEQLLDIGTKSAIIHGAAALVIPVIALSFVVKWSEIKANIIFVYLSILSCVVPYVIIAHFNYEFPSLVGGMIGLVISAFLASKNIGLARIEGTVEKHEIKGLVKALFPIWGTVLVLILTRIPELGLKGLITASTPLFSASLGSLGEFTLSTALIAQLSGIFGTTASWKFAALYIPAFIPFFLISGISFLLFSSSGGTMRAAWSETYGRMIRPIQALLGALVMVSLMRAGGGDSLVIVIGQYFAEGFGASWTYVASYLGAIGAFFSGSNTVSNLIFAGIQKSIAETAGLNVNLILAMQSVGGAMGNMVCINNVVAVCSIVGILNKEGYIITRTVVPMIIYGIIAAVVGVIIG
jgi:lactate permease